MKKILLNPLVSVFLVAFVLIVCRLWSVALYGTESIDFFSRESEVMTYTAYGVALLIAIYFWRDYIHTPKQTTYFALCFLWLAALLREMGIQHWLTKHDTTAIKIHFFTNPNNPLHEKIISASLVLLVLGVVLYLLIKYVLSIIKGFFRYNPLYWTICIFGGMLIISKIADRLPAHLKDNPDLRLTDYQEAWVTLFEESGEATLPLLFALALIQYHYLIKKEKS